MASNNIQKLKPDQLIALANQMKTTIGTETPNAYGVSTTQVSTLTSTDTALAAANTAAIAAKAAYHSAVQNRDAKQLACVNAVVSIAKTVYSNSAVTPSMISALGLQPHSTSRTKITPSVPTALVATPSADGSVELKWNRNGNPTGVNFLIETKSGTGVWTFLQDTTKAKIVLSGYTPGETVRFRVTASKNNLNSVPSAEAEIYPAGTGATTLRLAA